MITVPAASTSSLPPRLSPDALVELRLVSDLVGPWVHAALWALNYETAHRRLPAASQIIIGVQRDFGLTISLSSAARALQKIRADNFRQRKTSQRLSV